MVNDNPFVSTFCKVQFVHVSRPFASQALYENRMFWCSHPNVSWLPMLGFPDLFENMSVCFFSLHLC